MVALKKISLVAFLIGLSFSLAIAQKTFPEFSFTDLYGKTFTSNQLKKDMNNVAIFFDPYCHHCQKQAEFIKAAKAELEQKNVQLIWVTTEEADPAVKFYNDYLMDVKNCHVLRDPQFLFDAYFGYSEVPSIYVFDKNGKKVDEFHEEVPVQQLLKSL